MKSKIILGSLFCLVALVIYAASPNHVNRFGNQSILATGGTSTTTGKTVMVTEDSTTNEFSMATITATVAGSATASTNTFTTAYVATPVVIAGVKSGQSVAGVSSGVNATATTTTLIVTGLNSAGSTNNLPFIVYGYKRTGVFE